MSATTTDPDDPSASVAASHAQSTLDTLPDRVLEHPHLHRNHGRARA